MIEWLGAAAGALAVAGLSARFNWWRPRVAGIPVLMYHHITDQLNGTPLPKLRVRTRQFAAQLDFLHAHGYQAISLARALAPDPPANGVVISFDDGYENFYSQAWPLLRQRGMTATVFLTTAGLDGDNFWDRAKGEPSERLLTSAQVRELDAAGVEFGGHGHRHHNLFTLDQGELQRDVEACQEALIALLGRPCRVFSYPYGLRSAAVAQVVGRAGFQAACTTRPGKIAPGVDPLAVPRIIVKRSDTMVDLRLKLSRCRSRF